MLIFDRVLIVAVAVLAGGVLWIEHGHRVVIEAPAAAGAPVPSDAAVCPGNDTEPYSARCLDYLNMPAVPRPREQVAAVQVQPAPCPDSDRVPYSASCIAFMKGATELGMRWRATAEPPSTPVPQ